MTRLRTVRIRRKGASLLEVLFSIGIVAVGLLGVMVIIPLAGLQATRGTIADEADRMGRNAVRLFDAGRIGQTNMWAQYDTNTQRYFPFGGGESFCIDPVFMATHLKSVNFPTPPFVCADSDLVAAEFPYRRISATDSITRMRRVNVRAWPGASYAASGTPPQPSPWARPMSLPQAFEMCGGQDDLLFSLPDDRTLGPEQQFESGTTKRQVEGKYSWMATMTPKFDGDSDGVYVLSIVVFHRRYLDVDAIAGNPVAVDEHISEVTDFHSSGYGGGDVSLGSDVEDDLDLNEGDWIMLATTSGTNKVFRWYQVQRADAEPHVPDDPSTYAFDYTRDVTLFGQDWPFTAGTVHAVWMPGVVAVYEKTIRPSF